LGSLIGGFKVLRDLVDSLADTGIASTHNGEREAAADEAILAEAVGDMRK
jgi:hypothetical protein